MKNSQTSFLNKIEQAVEKLVEFKKNDYQKEFENVIQADMNHKFDNGDKPFEYISEMVRKEELDKDNKPHKSGSPEDSAHDVVEEDANLQEKLKRLHPSKRDEMVAHLRSLKEKSKLRDEKNREAGKEEDKEAVKKEEVSVAKNGQWNLK